MIFKKKNLVITIIGKNSFIKCSCACTDVSVTERKRWFLLLLLRYGIYIPSRKMLRKSLILVRQWKYYDPLVWKPKHLIEKECPRKEIKAVHFILERNLL